MRSKIYAIVTKGTEEDLISRVYDYIFCLISVLSLVPLMFHKATPLIMQIDTVTMYVLVLDYLLRWMTADIEANRRGDWKCFLLFPFHPLAILSALAILPSLGIVRRSWAVLRLMRIAALMHYSSQLDLLLRVLRKQSKNLLMVLGITVSYIFTVSLILFNSAADAFPSFINAVLWVSGTLTGAHYDSAVSQNLGVQIISTFSALMGIGIIALPTGIITTGFLEAIRERAEEKAAPPVEPTVQPVSKQPLNREVVRRYAVIMVLCMILNTVAYRIAFFFGLPVWLDTLGTMTAAIMLEPAAGLLVGFVNNLILASTTGNFAILYYSISAISALVAGLLLVKNRKILYARFLPVMLLLTGLAGSMSFLIYEMTTRGRIIHATSDLNVWEEHVRLILDNQGVGRAAAVFVSLVSVKLIDMAVSFLLLFLICRAADRLRKSRLPR